MVEDIIFGVRIYWLIQVFEREITFVVHQNQVWITDVGLTEIKYLKWPLALECSMMYQLKFSSENHHYTKKIIIGLLLLPPMLLFDQTNIISPNSWFSPHLMLYTNLHHPFIHNFTIFIQILLYLPSKSW